MGPFSHYARLGEVGWHGASISFTGLGDYHPVRW